MLYLTSVFLGFLAASEALHVGVAMPRSSAVAASKISMQVAAEAQVAQPVALAKVRCQALPLSRAGSGTTRGRRVSLSARAPRAVARTRSHRPPAVRGPRARQPAPPPGASSASRQAGC